MNKNDRSEEFIVKIGDFGLARKVDLGTNTESFNEEESLEHIGILFLAIFLCFPIIRHC